MALPPSPIAPALARAALRAISDVLPSTTRADLYLLTSELVANAVQHSGTREPDSVRLAALPIPSGVRVEVTDAGDGFDPEILPDWDFRENGMGLSIVDRLASRWGVDLGPDRTTVWFEIDAA